MTQYEFEGVPCNLISDRYLDGNLALKTEVLDISCPVSKDFCTDYRSFYIDVVENPKAYVFVSQNRIGKPTGKVIENMGVKQYIEFEIDDDLYVDLLFQYFKRK